MIDHVEILSVGRRGSESYLVMKSTKGNLVDVGNPYLSLDNSLMSSLDSLRTIGWLKRIEMSFLFSDISCEETEDKFDHASS
jgi:hypothetical protein